MTKAEWEIVTAILSTEDYCLEHTKESVHETLKEESDYSTSGLERGSVAKGILLLFHRTQIWSTVNTPSGGSQWPMTPALEADALF